MALQVSDVRREFELSVALSTPWMAQQGWVNKWTKVDLRTAYQRSQLFYFAFDRDNPSAPQYWGHALGRGDSFIRVVQDGLSELARRVLPFSYGVLQPSGIYDCQTAALATIARYWYRRDVSLPLPSTTELQWPELLLAFQVSPAMRGAIAQRWQDQAAGTVVPPYYQYKWVLPDPARQYTAPPMPQGCAAMRPEAQGFAETMGAMPAWPSLPEELLPQMPGAAPATPIDVDPIAARKDEPAKQELGWLKPVGIAALLGLSGVFLWSLAKEK